MVLVTEVLELQNRCEGFGVLALGLLGFRGLGLRGVGFWGLGLGLREPETLRSGILAVWTQAGDSALRLLLPGTVRV